MSSLLFWLWVGGALGQAAFTAANDDLARSFRNDFHRGGYSVMFGRLLGFALWPVMTVVFLIFTKSILRHVNERQHTKSFPVRCEVCGFREEFRVAHGRWLQETPYWYRDMHAPGDVTFCSYGCVAHWAEHHKGLLRNSTTRVCSDCGGELRDHLEEHKPGCPRFPL